MSGKEYLESAVSLSKRYDRSRDLFGLLSILNILKAIPL
jgi:hypothetical protein